MVTLSLFNILAIGMKPAYSKAKAQENPPDESFTARTVPGL